MRFSKKVEYALIALVNMGDAVIHDALYTSKSLSVQFNIPPEVMGKVLQALVRNGLLHSVQGVKGGYTISRPLDKINVLEIIEAVDGRMILASCGTNPPESCAQYGYCGIQTPLEIIQEKLVEFFTEISLLDIKNKYNGTEGYLNTGAENVQ